MIIFTQKSAVSHCVAEWPHHAGHRSQICTARSGCPSRERISAAEHHSRTEKRLFRLLLIQSFCGNLQPFPPQSFDPSWSGSRLEASKSSTSVQDGNVGVRYHWDVEVCSCSLDPKSLGCVMATTSFPSARKSMVGEGSGKSSSDAS